MSLIINGKSFTFSNELFEAVKSYIDKNFVEAIHCKKYLLDEKSFNFSVSESACEFECLKTISSRSCSKTYSAENNLRPFEDIIKNLESSFAEALFARIDEKGLTDPQVYKRANLDRKLFSKIRKNKNYKPSKTTAIALAIALELNLDETKDFIGKAGYALTHSSKLDVIVEYFIINGEYDIFKINEVLFAFEQPLLGLNVA